MTKPVFKITPDATATQTYLDYSSCRKKDKKFKFSEKDFKNVVKANTQDKNNITATELTSLFTGLTNKEASNLIANADTKGGKRGVKNDKLDWEELQVAIKTADEADRTFDGLVSFENFQTLVADPAAPVTVASAPSASITAPSAPVPTAPLAAKNTSAAVPVKENSYTFNQSKSDGFLGGNTVLALVGFAIFAGIGLSGGFGGGASRNNYYGYGGYC